MIVLIGFMGAGKTTVGRLLAGRLGLPFIDSDVVISERGGRPVRQIFADDGEPAFRQLAAWRALPWYRKLSVLVRNQGRARHAAS